MRSQAQLDAIVAGLREAHRELEAKLSHRAILRILAREGIARRPASIPASAMTVMQYGRAAIVYNPNRLKSPREEVAVLAEEYAHAKLHAGDPGEVVVHVSARASDDPREYEADYVARCLLAGPGVDVVYFRPAPPKGGVPRPALPAWMIIDPYNEARPYGGPRSREPKYNGASHHIRRGPSVEQRSVRVTTLRTFGAERADPNGVIEYSPDFTIAKYRHPEFGQWAVWDIAYFTTAGERKRFVLRGGQTEAAIYRQFRSATGAVRVYRFTSRLEPRTLDTKHLERQLRQAAVLTMRQLAQEKTG